MGDVGVSALVVSYNTRELLIQCIASLLESSQIKQIVVVDNASEDGSADALRDVDDRIRILANRSNVGFARAVNAGLNVAQDLHHLVINPDCLLTASDLNIMVGWLDAHPEVGLVAPATYHPSRRLGVLSAGEQPDLRRLALHYSGLSAAFHRYRWARGWNLLAGKHDDAPRSVAWVSGSCFLARQGLFAEVGGLSERWFMYAEDMEFCRRVAASGRKLTHLPAARATHVIGASSQLGPVNTRWVSVLIDYYRVGWQPGGFRRSAYQATLSLGLALRALVNIVRMVRSEGEVRLSYKTEARRGLAWARAALLPERDNLDSPWANRFRNA